MTQRTISLEAKEAAFDAFRKLKATGLTTSANNIFRLAKEFEQAHHVPPTSDQLIDDLKKRMSENGHIKFYFNDIAKTYPSYETVYSRLISKAPLGDKASPYHREQKHLLALGSIKPVDNWFYARGSMSVHFVADQLYYYASCGLEHAVDHALNLFKKRFSESDYQVIIELGLSKIDKNNAPAAFGKSKDWPLSLEQQRNYQYLLNFAQELDLSVIEAFGLDTVVELKKDIENFPRALFKQIRHFLSHETNDMTELNILSYQSALLFRNFDLFLNYCTRWPNRESGFWNFKKPLTIPNYDYYSNDHDHAWGDLACKYGPKVMYYLQYAPLIDSPLYKDNGEIDFAKTKSKIFDACVKQYGIKNDEIDLYRFHFNHALGLDEMNTAKFYIDEFNSIHADRSKVSLIPEVTISGAEFGLDGYEFKKLSYDDFRIFYPGLFTHSCERLNHACQNSVIHSYLTRESGFYVITDSHDKIVAHSWAWISDDNYLILDGFEASEQFRSLNDDKLKSLLLTLNDRIKEPEFSDYDFTGLAIGMSNHRFYPQDDFPNMDFISKDRLIKDIKLHISENLIKKNNIELSDIGYSYDFWRISNLSI